MWILPDLRLRILERRRILFFSLRGDFKHHLFFCILCSSMRTGGGGGGQADMHVSPFPFAHCAQVPSRVAQRLQK